MNSYMLLIQTNPDDIDNGLFALQQAEQLLTAGKKITQVFFYGQGVLYGQHYLSFPSGLPNLQAAWLELAKQYHFPLVVCATVGQQYGLEAFPVPAGTLAAGFDAGGLTEFLTLLANCSQLLSIPNRIMANTRAKNKGEHLLFTFSQSPLQAQSRHGLDMLLMAASLELPAAAFFDEQSIFHLVTPTTGPDPLKKITMLPNLFEFDAFYTSMEVMQQTQLRPEQLRVPIQVYQATELKQLYTRLGKHELRF